MPNAKVLEIKKQAVTELAAKLKDSCAGILVDYKGITVAEDTKLRAQLREAGVDYKVVKNTLLHLAVKEAGLEGLDTVLKGTTALAVSVDDYVVAARILSEFAEGHNKFSIKSGFMDGDVISVEMISSLAKLPSREVLLATVLNAFNAPIAAFARAVQAVVDKGGAQPQEETLDAAQAPAKEVVEEAQAPVEEDKVQEPKTEEVKAEDPKAQEAKPEKSKAKKTKPEDTKAQAPIEEKAEKVKENSAEAKKPAPKKKAPKKEAPVKEVPDEDSQK